MPASLAMSRVRTAAKPCWVKSFLAAAMIFSSVERSLSLTGAICRCLAVERDRAGDGALAVRRGRGFSCRGFSGRGCRDGLVAFATGAVVDSGTKLISVPDLNKFFNQMIK